MEKLRAIFQDLLSFKLSMLASISAFVIFLTIRNNAEHSEMILLLLSGQLFFFFFLIERSFTKKKRAIALVITAVIGACLYFMLQYVNNQFFSAQVFLVLSSVIMMGSFTPGTDEEIWLWQSSLIKSVFEAVLAACVYAASILAVASLVKLLFATLHQGAIEIAIKFGFTIVPAAVFIWRMKTNRDTKNLFVLSLLNYVIVPLWLIYTLILNIYVLKIIFAWDLPKGMVSLPICFSFIMMILCWWGLSFDQESFWSKRILKILVILHIPLLFLFAFAMARRVYDYGFTPHRSLLLVYWGFFAEVLYLMIKKKLTAKKLAYSFWLSQVLALLPV